MVEARRKLPSEGEIAGSERVSRPPIYLLFINRESAAPAFAKARSGHAKGIEIGKKREEEREERF